MPPDSSKGYDLALPSRRNVGSSSAMRSRDWRFDIPRNTRPSAALSSTLNQGKSRSFCGMYAENGCRGSRSPWKVTDPLVGWVCSARSVKSVDLPDPLGPITDTNSPGSSRMLMSLITGVDAPRGVGNDFATESTVSRGEVIVGRPFYGVPTARGEPRARRWRRTTPDRSRWSRRPRRKRGRCGTGSSRSACRCRGRSWRRRTR